jgi:AraC family transcriptional regulator of adaptative response/methylated-DNA-[protein]-cysteine methyltransferase
MNTQDQLNYNRISQAITYLQENFRRQPDLDEIADKIALSPFHFQRLFTAWAGVSPKKFLQFLSLDYAKTRLKAQETLFSVTHELGMSGTGRLHDLFITIEGMTPGEYKNGGENLVINYSFQQTSFGKILVASTSVGICFMAFHDDGSEDISALQMQFPAASYINKLDQLQQNALLFFQQKWTSLQPMKLHLKGTTFQLKVWETLLKIPAGAVTTYGQVSQAIEAPKASRAVGSAIGANPVALLIPCHRVIQASGNFGQYHWGSIRKTAILGWEAAQQHLVEDTSNSVLSL